MLRFSREWGKAPSDEAADHYREIMKAAGFEALRQAHIFREVAAALDYKFPVFMVDEVGYKLSKRKEKARPINCAVSEESGQRPTAQTYICLMKNTKSL